MPTSTGHIERVRDSPVAVAALAVAVFAVLVALLVTQIGAPPVEAWYTTGVAAIVLLLVGYDWYSRRSS
ncbi:hypothetical protein [Halapricum salinum]|uniref:Uncharacterized protein n=1 Tax=Halapricum salinum TaxID=1457250 RepID=A0A4D6H8V4_9EURY|nr:hypothetical protein [Halapricum salinum]QCC50279.1 hypothetical protein DV733_03080 [Halapricum salinum]